MKHSPQIVEVPCDGIQIGERYRRDMGDLQALAASIATEGLLQPIGITEDHRLVFGARRLLAIRDLLKWPSVPARVVEVSSILMGEWVENELRRAFTASERVAIARALQDQIGERQGARTDLELRGNRGEGELVENPPQVPPGVKTREVAAEKAGFGSTWTYQQARKVVEQAVDEVVAQMDSGELSISAAALIAEQPPERQRQIAQMPRAEKREAVRKLRRKDLPTPEQARCQARQTGLAILDRNLTYQLPVTEEQRPLIELNYAAIEIIDAVTALARSTHPAQAIAAAIRRLDTPDMDFVGRCRTAARYLNELNQELNPDDQQ